MWTGRPAAPSVGRARVAGGSPAGRPAASPRGVCADGVLARHARVTPRHASMLARALAVLSHDMVEIFFEALTTRHEHFPGRDSITAPFLCFNPKMAVFLLRRPRLR